jgi:hypothetical protein
MAELQSGLVLSEDETLALEIKAKLVVTSSFLFIRIALEWIRFFTQILGFAKEGYIVVTNKRVSEIYRQRFLWLFHARKTIKNIRPYFIKEVDYTKKGTFAFLFRRYHLYYERSFIRIYAVLSGLNETETQRAANTFYAAISRS